MGVIVAVLQKAHVDGSPALKPLVTVQYL